MLIAILDLFLHFRPKACTNIRTVIDTIQETPPCLNVAQTIIPHNAIFHNVNKATLQRHRINTIVLPLQGKVS